MNILYNAYLIMGLRVLHVASGVMWVGSAALYLFLLIPAVRSVNPAGPKFMQNFGPRFGAMMRVVTTATVLSGALLYARFFSGGISWIWETGAGIGFTVGALAALGSYAIGAGVIGPLQEQAGALGGTLAAAGGPPQPEQLARLQSLDARLLQINRIDFVLLAVSVAAMAVARYL